MTKIIVVDATAVGIKAALEKLDAEFVDEVPEDMLIKRGPDLSELENLVITPKIEERPFRQRSKKAPRKW